MQRLQPVKHEATYGGDLAIASVNLHHDHFGIGVRHHPRRRPAHSACLAFGLERWLFALTTGTARTRGLAPARRSGAESEGTPMTGTTLITGADGYVGRRVAAALLEAGDDHLVLAMRAGDTAEFADKRAALQRTLPPAACRPDQFHCRGPAPRRGTGSGRQESGHAHRALRRRHPLQRRTGRGPVRQRRGHGAGRRVRCHVPQPSAPGFAVDAVQRGGGSGEVAERQHGDAGFANHYEWSKWAAEQAVLTAADLPVSVLRLPTIVADDDDGEVTQYNAFHNTLKLYFYGLLSLVPGTRRRR